MRWDKKNYIERNGKTFLATTEEFIQCLESDRHGNCSHAVFTDNHSMMYDYRRCAVCLKQLDIIKSYNEDGTSNI